MSRVHIKYEPDRLDISLIHINNKSMEIFYFYRNVYTFTQYYVWNME